jgi:hypothetical protein
MNYIFYCSLMTSTFSTCLSTKVMAVLPEETGDRAIR